jgi:hypothetical protein
MPDNDWSMLACCSSSALSMLSRYLCKVSRSHELSMLSWGQRNVAPFVSASTQQNRDTRTYEYVLFLAPIGTTFNLSTSGQSNEDDA